MDNAPIPSSDHQLNIGKNDLALTTIQRIVSKQPTVLVVDDSEGQRRLLEKIVEKIAAHPIGVESGEDALEVIRKTPVDLILLDIKLEGIDGFEVCKRIRKSHRHIPIIFITGYSSKEYLMKCFEIGGQDFIAKPVDMEELAVRMLAQIKTKIQVERLRTLNAWLEKRVFAAEKTMVGEIKAKKQTIETKT